MKTFPNISDSVKNISVFAVAAVCLWSAWFFSYPYFLRWLEGFNYFSTLPDFVTLNLDVPGKAFRYFAAFLLQFFTYPAAGALVLAFFPVLTVFSVWVVLRRIFKEGDSLLWVAFLVLPLSVSLQMGDLTLIPSLTWFCICAAVALTVYVFTSFRRVAIPLPGILTGRWLCLAFVALSVIVSVLIVCKGEQNRRYEEIAYLEYLGDNQEWDKIIESVSVQDAARNEYKRKYVLLALSEKGALADYAFAYGLSGSEDFLYDDSKEPLQQNFNMTFYRALGLTNAVVYHAYQQSLQSVTGLTSRSVRYLADAYLEAGDYVLAKKYMDIMRRSACQGKWLEERIPVLESIKGAEPEYKVTGERFLWGQFLPDMSALVERYPDNEKYSDYLLCALLADRHGMEFYEEFKKIAPLRFSSGERIPLIYQQALMMFIGNQPEELRKYAIDDAVMDSFIEFTRLLQTGRESYARRKYAGTYWSYLVSR